MIIITIILIIIVFLVSSYNTIVSNKNQIQNAISSLDALFIQRSDLIPNMVATAKRYAIFERETLERIIELRNSERITNQENAYIQEDKISSLLKELRIQIENYPELKTNEQFMAIQRQLINCEEQIAAGRRFVSSSITIYNNSIVVFPNILIARSFGFVTYQWQYAQEKQKEVPKVDELFQK